MSTYVARTRLSDSRLSDLLEELYPFWLEMNRILKGHHVCYQRRVLLVLMYLRLGLTQEELGEFYDIGQQTVSDIIHEVLPLISELGVLTRDGALLRELDETLLWLHDNDGAALLDGLVVATHEVSAPGYFSGKHRVPGFNVQVLAGLDGLPMWTADPVPGGTNDSRAADETGVYEAGRRLELLILADLAYRASATLTPPRRRPRVALTEVQQQCKDAHSSVRSAVERAIRRLRTWRILGRRSLPRHLLGHMLRAILVLESRKSWT